MRLHQIRGLYRLGMGPGCLGMVGLSDSGQTFTVRVTVTEDDYGNTGQAEGKSAQEHDAKDRGREEGYQDIRQSGRRASGEQENRKGYDLRFSIDDFRLSPSQATVRKSLP
jgi:hypothetical protein